MIFSEKSDRRSFLLNSTTIASAVTIGLTAKSYANADGANDKVNIGIIGLGNRGSDLLNQALKLNKRCKVVAVCDLYEKRKQAAIQRSEAKGYDDYRDILKRSDIDAVFVATPDHWHSKITLDAFDAGKDVYCEKPMTMTIEQAKEVVDACKRLKRVMQVGSQYASLDMNWNAREIIQSGKVGKLVWAQGTYSRNSREGEWNWAIDPEAGPDKTGENHIDWKTWLGTTKEVPFDKERFFRFRKFWDYSGGIATDLFYHKLSALTVACGDEFPSRVTSSGGIWVQKDGREVPDTFLTNIDYPSGRSVNMPCSMASNIGVPTIVRANYGTIYFDDPKDGCLRVVGEEPFMDEFKAANGGKESYVVESKPREGHMENFFTCVKTREEPNLCAQRGYTVMVPIAMAVQSYRENKVLCFDEKSEKIVDCGK